MDIQTARVGNQKRPRVFGGTANVKLFRDVSVACALTDARQHNVSSVVIGSNSTRMGEGPDRQKGIPNDKRRYTASTTKAAFYRWRCLPKLQGNGSYRGRYGDR